jgi:ribosomal protein S27AE
MSKLEILKNVGLEIVNNEEKLITSKKYDFKCSKGHIWNSRLDNVLRSLDRASKGCPTCAKEITDKLSEKAVEKNLIKGHKIVSYEIKQVKSDGTKERFYTVECPNNHLYEKRTPALREGCPKCSTGVFVGEERVKVIFETHFGKRFKKIRPEWLKNPNTQSKMEIDGYNEELKVGFEYQGRQHYSNNTQFAGEQENQYQ